LEPRLVLDGTVSVDPSIQYQTLEGWGTSLAWWANVVGGFPDYARNDYINKIFDPVNGLGLNVVRYNIGGGENPAYHFLQYRAAVPGYEPAPGIWDWTADANQRWVLQAAIASGVNQLEAFSNSPPYWMTNSGSVTGAVGGGDNLNPNYYGAFADYLTQVVQQFANSWGITFQTLEPLNEPNASWWQFGNWQEGCHFDRSSQDAIIQDVGASLAGYGSSTTVAAPDENSIDGTVTSFSSYSSAAQAYLSQINTHSYGGSERTQLANLANSYSKDLWMSEYGDNDATGLTMSRQILNDMKNLRPTAWVYWQAVDNAGGWGFLKNPLQDEITTAYTINEKYYVMGNYSKFIRPGYQFIAINDANSLAAYDASSGTLVIVTTNSDTADTNVTYDLSGFSSVGDSVTPYRTSASEHLTQLSDIGVTNASFTAVAKAQSVTTYVLSGVTYTGALGFNPSTYYELVNRNSGLVMDVTGASTQDGTQVIQWYENGNANQQWAFVGLGAGYYKVVSRNSGLLLDVTGESLLDGASVIQWHDHDGANQHWSIADTGDGSYTLINQNSGLLLDVSGGSTDAGANVIQWHDDAGASQQWTLVQVPSPQTQAPARLREPSTTAAQAVAATVEGKVQARQQTAARLDVPDVAAGLLSWDDRLRSGTNSQVDPHPTPAQDEAFLQPAESFIVERRTRSLGANLASWEDWAEDPYLLADQLSRSNSLEPVHRRWGSWN
jgi:O-glycosyl hydrolase